MDKFQTLTASCLPFLKDDIDTDQVIPARFLTGTTKTGLGEKLFYDWRYDDQGELKADAVFNADTYDNSQILVSGRNFGCGSSREHAPWALKDYGFSVVLAVSFADIFYNNALKNGLLPVALPEAVITQLVSQVEGNAALTVTIDLAQQHVIIPEQGTFDFEISGFRKQCLLEGLDDVAYVMSHMPAIEAFEAVAST